MADGVDGDLARLKGMTSSFGAFFDAVLDRYADAAIILGMTFWVARNSGSTAWMAGIAALLGSLMVSYSWARAEATLNARDDIPFFSMLASRDMRLLLVMIGGVLRAGLEVLIALASLTHLTVLLRILYFARTRRA